MASALDPDRYRMVFGHFATGVAVITVAGPAGEGGLTANAVCSVSLDPLLALVCFEQSARTLPLVRDAGRFAVNVLRAGQHHLSGQFASKLPLDQKFAAVDYRLEQGVPVLEEALAWLACEMRQELPGGDHTIGIGAVLAMDHGEGDPLVWYRGSYTSLRGPNTAPRAGPAR
jgi:flavin reductase (DIM6/NTAB) family NADH-FMN oxidoreductase RutF